MIYKSIYISDGHSENQQLYNIESALDAGQKGIQFRFKNTEHIFRCKTAEKAKTLCDRYDAQLLINDHIDIALAVDAAGVHLGLTDTDIATARTILKNKIIGGTANNIQHLLQRQSEGCDYIGLGPYRFTATKKNLHPILGIEGFKLLSDLSLQNQITTPIIAIGGIQMNDIPLLLETSVYGIAFSSLLNHSKNKQQTVTQLNHLLNGTL